MRIYSEILNSKAKGRKLFALLIDPDKVSEESMKVLVKEAIDCSVDLFFVGGSLILNDSLAKCVKFIKDNCPVPVILFPGSTMHISKHADALLLLSLISGRNPEMLIGRHVEAAPKLRNSSLEIISTGYILVDSGVQTAVSYMSYTTPIPGDKADIAMCTAMAGEMLGMKLIFLDGGSGAKNPVSASVIEAVSKHVFVPLIVGGGIKTPEKALENCKAGADVIVVGNAVEKDVSVLRKISEAVHSFR
jgi:phosphoglycerol geranylgeranyltransferase